MLFAKIEIYLVVEMLYRYNDKANRSNFNLF